MKVRYKILLIIAAVSSSVFLAVYSVLYFTGRINTFEPVTVNISGCDKAVVYGISPFGRKIPFIKTGDSSFYSNYSFFRTIAINSDSRNYSNYHLITMKIGYKKYFYSWKGTSTFIKPYDDKGDLNYFKALISIFHWGFVIRLAASAAILAILWIFLPLLLKVSKRAANIFTVKFLLFSAILSMAKKKLQLNILNPVIHQLRKKAAYLLYHKIDLLKILLVLFLQFCFLCIIIVLISVFFNDCLLRIFKADNSFLYTVILILFLCITVNFFSLYCMRILKLRKTLRWNMILLSIMFHFSLIVAELGLRLTKSNQIYMEVTSSNRYISQYISPKNINNVVPDIDHKGIYDDVKNEFTFSYPVFSFGLCDNYFNSSIKKGNLSKIRILSLGDSFTYGIGAPCDSSWCRLLESILNHNGKRFEVFNAGLSGFDPFYSYVLFHKRLIDYNPHIILLAVNGSDIVEAITRGGFERFEADGSINYLPGNRMEWLFATSYLTRLIMLNGLKYNYLLRPDQGNYSTLKDAVRILNPCFQLFKYEENKFNYKFIPIFHPLKSDFFENGYTVNNFNGWYRKHISDLSINLYEYFIKTEQINKSNVQNYYWRKDSHHNGRGYEAFARGVASELKRMGLLDTLFSNEKDR